ncbi:hypothetical protein GMRT_11648 [Giardia muris]|uniref:Uncharacterized protein n=1 Tax=Giardia muris TaxID=5742 RepID=A0A4Z1T1I6_GIAMU|nr:hypothetical protein GMRT_11648 [Giardia muris]|eukprot:TNJ29558.1 hypothetical protein GMRT_11648 [Giardia muris]
MQSTTVSRLLAEHRPCTEPAPCDPRTRGRASSESRRSPRIRRQHRDRDARPLDPIVTAALDEADLALSKMGKEADGTSGSPKEVGGGFVGFDFDDLIREIRSGNNVDGTLRELLVSANQRIRDLEGALKRLRATGVKRWKEEELTTTMIAPTQKAQESITPKSSLASSMVDQKQLMALEAARDKLSAKCQRLTRELLKERAEHEEAEKAIRLEVMGLSRRLKYSLQQQKALEKKIMEQEKYIKDCETAVLKQYRTTETLRSCLSKAGVTIQSTNTNTTKDKNGKSPQATKTDPRKGRSPQTSRGSIGRHGAVEEAKETQETSDDAGSIEERYGSFFGKGKTSEFTFSDDLDI